LIAIIIAVVTPLLSSNVLFRLDCAGDETNAHIVQKLDHIDKLLNNYQVQEIFNKLEDVDKRLEALNTTMVGTKENNVIQGATALDLLAHQIQLRRKAHEQQKQHLQEYRDVVMGMQNSHMNALNAWVIQAYVLWWMYENTYQCPVDERLGRNGDGGKWICNPDVFAASPCVLYSFGVKDDFSFEVDSHKRMGCKEQLYDPTISVDPVRRELSKYDGINIDAVGIADNDDNTQYQRLSTLMQRNGHKYIDILKIDVEGAERDVFKDFFAIHNKAMQLQHPGADPADYPIATLILVELHYPNGDKWPPSDFSVINSWHDFFKLLENQGYAIYHKEMNLYDPKGAEYAFVHMAKMEQLENEYTSSLSSQKIK
jgi:hypothetical protein